VSNEYLDALDVDERAGRYQFDARGPDEPVTWVAAQDDVVVGLVTVGLCRDEGRSAAGEVWALYVEPASWRSGVGSRLLAKGEELVVESGCAEATLWVLEGNAQGRRFYEGARWRFDGTRQTIHIGERDLGEVRYVKSLSRE
jgi:GNAT superfamily N-acetyltransferase